jgi:hypothetical protein
VIDKNDEAAGATIPDLVLAEEVDPAVVRCVLLGSRLAAGTKRWRMRSIAR